MISHRGFSFIETHFNYKIDMSIFTECLWRLVKSTTVGATVTNGLTFGTLTHQQWNTACACIAYCYETSEKHCSCYFLVFEQDYIIVYLECTVQLVYLVTISDCCCIMCVCDTVFPLSQSYLFIRFIGFGGCVRFNGNAKQ